MEMRIHKGIPWCYLVCAAIACAVLAGRGAAAAESRYQEWQKDKPFTIGAMYYDLAFGPEWWKPAPPAFKTDPAPELLREAGLNLLSEVSMSEGGHVWYPGIRGARGAGMPFFILGGPWGPMKNFEERMGWLAGEKDLYGVQLADEPRNPEDQRLHRQQHEWIVDQHPCLLTLFCEGLTDIPGWTKEWEAIRSDAIVYQWYPYHTSDADSPTISPPLYACLAHASAFCTSRGLGFFVARGTAGQRSESTLRLNTYAALAHGCDGFLDWKWGTGSPAGGYVWYKEKTCQGPAANFAFLAAVNKEVARLGPTLNRLRHARTYHLDRPTHITWAGTHYGFEEGDELRTGRLKAVRGESHPDGDPLMVGFFRDGRDEEYFMVVNKNDTRVLEANHGTLAQQVTLVFGEEVPAIERFNRETGKVERLELIDHAFSFSLPGGTGDLFKYASDLPFAGG
jgi:hypothetical protein